MTNGDQSEQVIKCEKGAKEMTVASSS